MEKSVKCPYCGSLAELMTGGEVYPGRGDLKDKFFYRCSPCDAHVGCHPGGKNPLGQLANCELRGARVVAHAAFDPIWKMGGGNRSEAYAWLAKSLGIPKSGCHIAKMDVAMCKRVTQICHGCIESLTK